MCGLAGIIGYHPGAPAVDAQALERMREAMVPRGPDGHGQWISDDGRVGLAHRRLAILDLSEAGAQPMHGTDGRVSITYNGEIYNFRALREALRQGGVQFRSHSDTEVLLALYERDGPGFVEKLRGMFALALWDADKRGVLLARDPFGIKPLYFADDGYTLRVASQVKALLAGGEIDTTPDPAGYVGFLTWGAVPEPFTLYRAVRALPAGHTLWLDRTGRREERCYFDPAARLAHAATEPMDPARVHTALADSVAHHLIADVPVGVFLSAGLDSASLLGLATGAHDGPVTAFTLGFDEFQNTPRDEVPLARRIAAHYGARHEIGHVRARDFQDAKTQILADMDQPSIDGVNTWFVAAKARQAGLKVALSGVGGDEVFGGYDTFAQVPRLKKLMAPLKGIPGLGAALRAMRPKSGAAVSWPASMMPRRIARVRVK